MRITTLKNAYTKEEAEGIVWNADKRVNIVQTEEIYYPYYRMRYTIVVGGKSWNKLNKLAYCIVDLVDGRPAESRGEPDYQQIEIEPSRALPIAVSKEECYKKSHDFVLKLYLNKAKLLHVPGMEILSEELFYKKFYLVQCKDAQDLDYFLMVDSIEGELSILDS
ncbi:MAG: hypothetical protein RR661_03155 [Anaerovoracaceae bacterium]